MGPTLDDTLLSMTNHKPSADAVAKVERIREAAMNLAIAIYRESEASRERTLAITKMEEAVMWAVKGIVIPRQERLL